MTIQAERRLTLPGEGFRGTGMKNGLAPWKKSYDKSRQHIKKQRYHFASKGPYSQSYGLSSSQIWM